MRHRGAGQAPITGGLSPTSLADLEAFMKVSRAGLMKPLKEGDYDGLVEVMGHLMKVKERQTATDNMFEPLKQTIELLKSYGEEMPEETHVKLQVNRPGGPLLGELELRAGPEEGGLLCRSLQARPPLLDMGSPWNGRVGGQGSLETRGQ